MPVDFITVGSPCVTVDTECYAGFIPTDCYTVGTRVLPGQFVVNLLPSAEFRISLYFLLNCPVAGFDAVPVSSMLATVASCVSGYSRFFMLRSGMGIRRRIFDTADFIECASVPAE